MRFFSYLRASTIVGLLSASSVMALPPCVEPSAPYCVSGWTTYEDEFAFNSCRLELDNYLSEVDGYLRCLDDWVQDTVSQAHSAQSAVISNYEFAVGYFNCKAADPDRYC